MIMTAHRMQPTASTELMTMTDAEHGAHGMHYVVFEQVRYLNFEFQVIVTTATAPKATVHYHEDGTTAKAVPWSQMATDYV